MNVILGIILGVIVGTALYPHWIIAGFLCVIAYVVNEIFDYNKERD